MARGGLPAPGDGEATCQPPCHGPRAVSSVRSGLGPHTGYGPGHYCTLHRPWAFFSPACPLLGHRNFWPRLCCVTLEHVGARAGGLGPPRPAACAGCGPLRPAQPRPELVPPHVSPAEARGPRPPAVLASAASPPASPEAARCGARDGCPDAVVSRLCAAHTHAPPGPFETWPLECQQHPALPHPKSQFSRPSKFSSSLFRPSQAERQTARRASRCCFQAPAAPAPPPVLSILRCRRV